MKKNCFSKFGFTLIELLIVVAIIAILAAIAVPNFLEAQVRAKVSRVRNDMRALSVAEESYMVDQNNYVPDRHNYVGIAGPWGGITDNDLYLYTRFTTPVAYMTSIPVDPFGGARRYGDGANNGAAKVKEIPYYFYFAGGWIGGMDRAYPPTPPTWNGFVWRGKYLFLSPGPDKAYNYAEHSLRQDVGDQLTYDSTNGTISFGDIIRMGP